MKFIVLIVALLLMQYWGSARPLHNDDWYRQLVQKLSGSGLSPGLQLAMAVLVPMALVYSLMSGVSGMLYGIVVMAASVVVLLYSFGRSDFEGVISRYKEFCATGNFEGAYLYASETLCFDRDSSCPSEPEKLHRWMKERILYLGYERWFAVIFYFALFGVAAAAGYRLLHLYAEFCEDEDGQEVRRKVLYAVDWLPSRLLILAFAITGDWVGSREQVATSVQDLDSPAGEAIADAAHAALGLKTTVFVDNDDVQAFAQVSEWEIDQIRQLLSRSAIAWVVAISLLVVFI
jgi:AmpE protein